MTWKKLNHFTLCSERFSSSSDFRITFQLWCFIFQAVFLTYHVLQVNKRVIDSHNLHLLGGETSTGHQTTDAAKSEKWTLVFLSLASRWWYHTMQLWLKSLADMIPDMSWNLWNKAPDASEVDQYENQSWICKMGYDIHFNLHLLHITVVAFSLCVG